MNGLAKKIGIGLLCLSFSGCGSCVDKYVDKAVKRYYNNSYKEIIKHEIQTNKNYISAYNSIWKGNVDYAENELKKNIIDEIGTLKTYKEVIDVSSIDQELAKQLDRQIKRCEDLALEEVVK